MKFYGYPRPDGKVGTRNYVGLVPTTGCVNNLCSYLEKLVRGTKALRHDQGCLHPAQDTKQVTRTLVNLGKNPNIGGAVVVALGCEMVVAEEVYEGIKETGKPVDMLVMHEVGGMISTLAETARKAVKIVSQVTAVRREEFGLDKLIMGTKCGSSDTTSGLCSNLVAGEVCKILTENGGRFIQGEICDIMGAEYALKKLAIDQDQGEKIVDFVRDLYLRGLAVGADIRGCQMTVGNVAGGLTTLVEKALGANAKGGNTPIQGVVDYGELIPDQPGRYIMNFPGHGFENLTASAAGGATLHLFTTGRGADTGHPIMPTIKVCGNARTNKTMAEHIDLDVASVIEETETIQDAGERVYEYCVQVANGRLTMCEILNTESMEILIKGPVI